MENEKLPHLKDVLKKVSHIVIYNDINDVHFFNFLELTEDVDDIEDSEEAFYLGLTDEQLKGVKNEKIHTFTNLELLDRICKLDKSKLSAEQISLLREKYKEKIIVDRDDVEVFIECIKSCKYSSVADRRKNREFMDKYDLSEDDAVKLFKSITINDYVNSTRSINKNHFGNNLIVFEPIVKLNGQKTPICIYVKIDLDETTGDSIAYISFHDGERKENLPYEDKNEVTKVNMDKTELTEATETGVKSNGIYSVMEDKWIKEPVQADIPDLDKEAFDKVFNEWEDKYFELLKKIGKTGEETHIAPVDDSTEETSEKEILTESNEDKSELISNFIEDLYDLRKDSIATEGEYGIGNLVFKEFRNLGYLDNLKDLKNEERSKELSLENLNEDIDDDMNTANDYEYGPADSLPEMTPYMLRQDGALLKCGDIHPYIKMSTKTSYETNLHTLNLHPEFLDWFYENTLDPVTKDLIDKFRKEPTPELMDVLNDLTNEDFCRVRTSNYKVKSGGKNGQIYFRISSTNFDWFNLIWGVVAKFVHDIDNVTVMKDSQTFGGKEFDYYYDHVPVDEFLTLKGNPEIK